VRWSAPLLLLVLVAVACAAGKSAAAGDAYGRALIGLCSARAQADRTPSRVRSTFFDRSHDTLHRLARALERVDRALTARLLEAKNVIEADVAFDPPSASLAADLDRLIGATRAGLRRLDEPAPGCAA
jgi:hypothetical protein